VPRKQSALQGSALEGKFNYAATAAESSATDVLEKVSSAETEAVGHVVCKIVYRRVGGACGGFLCGCSG